MRFRGGGIGHQVNAAERHQPVPDHAEAGRDEVSDSEEDMNVRDVSRTMDNPQVCRLDPNDDNTAGNSSRPSHAMDPDPDPDEDDGGEVVPDADADELADEAEEYGYEHDDEIAAGDDDAREEEDIEDDELGPEDGEGEDDDDTLALEGYAPF